MISFFSLNMKKMGWGDFLYLFYEGKIYETFIKVMRIAVAIFFALCFLACENQLKKQGDVPLVETFVITFSSPEHGNLVAKRKNDNAEFKSGNTTIKDEIIMFTIILEDGYEVEGWNVAQEDTDDKNKAML